MKVKILGSVSPYSKGKCNCPGYLVTNKQDKILLDCGNGISREMKMPEDLINLTIIISHLHKDHFGELLSLGYASYVYNKLGYLDKKINVYIPNNSKEDLMDYKFLNCFGEENFFKFIIYDENDKIKLTSSNITFCKSIHQTNAFSIKVKDNTDTLVYSGDTGYMNNKLETFAKNVDLLICESTFLLNQKKEKDYHLYASEAALIAKKANVYKLLLTHFWPEIDKQEYLDEAVQIFSNTDVAIEGKELILKRI